MSSTPHESTAAESGACPYARAWNIALRTAHIAMFAPLVGGHVFDVPPARLLPWLYAAVITGAVLVVAGGVSTRALVLPGPRRVVWLKLILLVPDSLPVGLPGADSVRGDRDGLGRIAHAGQVPVLLSDPRSRAGLERPGLAACKCARARDHNQGDKGEDHDEGWCRAR